MFVQFDGANGSDVFVNVDQVFFVEPVRNQVGLYRLVIAVLLGPQSILEHMIVVKATAGEIKQKLGIAPVFAGMQN